MIKHIRDLKLLKILRKQTWYCRARQYLPMPDRRWLDDSDHLPAAERVTIDWPPSIPKPRVALVPDFEPYPRWTKFARFLQSNAFEFELFDIHSHDWHRRARQFELVVGIWACDLPDVEQVREKFHFLEAWLGKAVFPSVADAMLYENKRLECWIAESFNLPFAPTFISHDKRDALKAIPNLRYPLVSKLVPSSGSVGAELVQTPDQARRIVLQAFSRPGRKTHMIYARQKNYVYFQEFVANDGHDIRVIVVGSWVFGYYRKVLEGDFRASGMNLVEKRALPGEAMALARKLQAALNTPMLVVDFVRGLDGQFWIIEYSPVCQMELPEQLHVDGVPGAYAFDNQGRYTFKPGKWWVHELALREFLVHYYLPKVRP